MTALCGGGPSGPQSGVGGVLTIGAAAIEVFISGLGFPELAPVAAPIIAGLVDIQIAAYCGTDPPADPGMTAAVLGDAIAIPPSFTTFQSQQKILQWFEARYWYQICQCTGTTTPAPSTPSNPGTISTDSGLPVQSTPCWSVSVPWTVTSPSSPGGTGLLDITPVALPAGPVTLIPITPPAGGLGHLQSVPMPLGATKLGLSVVFNEPVVTPGDVVTVFWDNFLASLGPVGHDNPHVGQDDTGLLTTNVYNAATLNTLEVTRAVYVETNDTVDHSGTATISFFCPPGTNVGAACCPPDPILEGELQQILQYVQAIHAGIPASLTSFAESTVHTGLSGSFNLVLGAATIAVKMQLTTIPARVGQESGQPTFYFDVGYITFSTTEGPYPSQRIEHQGEIFTKPPLGKFFYWNLTAGVVATMTELTAGP